MPLVYGKAISSEEVETIVSRQFTPTKLASLCNAIVWASVGRQCKSIPSFTERVNVKDGGIDAEWMTDLADDGSFSTSLLGPGWNVFQYKQRDVNAQGRDTTFKNLKAGLKGAIKSLYTATKRRPDRYVIFHNIDVTHFTKGQKGLLKKAILAGYDLPNNVTIEIIGAAEIAAFLNDLPHLRLGFFQTEAFLDWGSAWQAHKKEKIFGANIDLIGRETELDKLRAMVEDTNIRAIVLTGQHNIGKTRLVLQATDQRIISTVIALDPRSMNASGLLALESSKIETIAIIEDPEPDTAEEFVRQTITHTGLKLLITLPTSDQAPVLNFGQDPRIQVLELGPLSDIESHKLLQAAGSRLDYNMELWLVEQAGGNPGILLIAASLGVDLRKTVGSFFNNIGITFERRVQSRLGDQAIKTLRLLSLMTHIGLKGIARNEIEAICSQFGDGQHINAVLNDVERLVRAGVLRTAGSYAEVIPPLFANQLALSAVRGRIAGLHSLLIVLGQPGRLRLLRRLQLLKGDEIDKFWDDLLGPNGLLKDPVSLLTTDSQLLRLLTDKAPERVAPRLENWLKTLSTEERLKIGGALRRELMRILEQLLFRRRTSLAALQCLALLAEAETETIGNNATGVFCECFSPRHRQFPLSLRARLDYLKAMFATRDSVALRQVGIQAIKHALEYFGGLLILRRSSGPEPFDPPPPMTYGEIYDYIEALTGLLLDIVQSDEPELSRPAAEAIPRALITCANQTRPAAAVALFRVAVELTVTRKSPISVARLVEALQVAHESFDKREERAEPEIATEFESCQHEITELIECISTSDFATRLRRWTSEWTREGHEQIGSEGSSRYRFDIEMEDLANESTTEPALLTDDLLSWLCSPNAKRSGAFFWYLGKDDTGKRMLAKIEEIAIQSDGATPFASYIGGLGSHDRPFCADRLSILAQNGQVTAESIVMATARLGGDLAGVLRLETLIQTGRINPLFVQQTLMYGWLDSLTLNEFARLLIVIAGSDFENAMAAIDLLNSWLHSNKVLDDQLAVFAWQCLETAPVVGLNDSYSCENLAANLVKFDTERGFRLLDNLLRQPYDRGSWLPVGEVQSHNAQFWNMLHQVNAERALRAVFTAILEDAPNSYRVDLNEIVNQESDAELLIALAHESEEQAILVCKCLNFEQPSCWRIATGVLWKYPDNPQLLRALMRSIMHFGFVTLGPGNEYDMCLSKVEQMLADSLTSPVLLPLLMLAESELRATTRRESSWFMDKDINGWSDKEDNPASPERLWAIRELVHAGKDTQIQRLLSKDELQRILPDLGLLQQEENRLNKLIEQWDQI